MNGFMESPRHLLFPILGEKRLLEHRHLTALYIKAAQNCTGARESRKASRSRGFYQWLPVKKAFREGASWFSFMRAYIRRRGLQSAPKKCGYTELDSEQCATHPE